MKSFNVLRKMLLPIDHIIKPIIGMIGAGLGAAAGAVGPEVLGALGSSAIGAAGSAFGGEEESKESEKLARAKRKQQELETQVNTAGQAPSNLMANFLANGFPRIGIAAAAAPYGPLRIVPVVP